MKQNEENKIQNDMNEKHCEKNINDKSKQEEKSESNEIEEMNSKILSDTINKEFQASNDDGNLNSSLDIKEFKKLMENLEGVEDVNPIQNNPEDKKEEVKIEEEKDEEKLLDETKGLQTEEIKYKSSSLEEESNVVIYDFFPRTKHNSSNYARFKKYNDAFMEYQIKDEKVDKVQNPSNEIPGDIKTTDLTEMQEYKLYYNYTDLYMIRVAKYLEKEIILICNEVKTEEPNFFFQAHYTLDGLIKICYIFGNYQGDEQLYEFFINSFDNNSVKLSKDVNEDSYIKLYIKAINPDGDNIFFLLQLFRKERDYNPEFYDTYINVKRQLEREQEKKKVLHSYEEDRDYHHSINYNHSVLEEYSKIKIPGQIIDPEEEIMEINKKRRKTPKKVQNSGDNEKDILNYFNTKYRLKMAEEDRQIDLNNKGRVSDDVNKLCKIKFQCVDILYLNNNKIINIDAFGYSTFHNLKILRLNNNVIAKIGRLGSCSFLSHLKELYLYNNKLTSLDEFSGVDFSELRVLHISNNCLTNVDALGYCKFKHLTQLLLYDNQISQIDTLGNCDFSQLKVLSIYYNRLTNVNALAKTNLGNLVEMTLSRNKINNLEGFPQMNLANLKLLVLHNNSINNIEPLTRCNFFELKNCLMYCNKVSKASAKNQKIIADMKAKYPKLTYLRI